MTDVRETFSSEELAKVLSHYDLGIVADVREFPRGARAAAKVVLRTDRGKFLLKRRPVGKNDRYRVAFAHSLQLYLASKHFPLPHLIGTRENNNSMLRIGDSIYEAFEFIEGERYRGTMEQTIEAGRTLALYHTLVRDFHSEWEPPQSYYHDSRSVVDSFGPMREVLVARPSATGKLDELSALLHDTQRAYARAAKAVNDAGMNAWESQIIHSDWHPGNTIFKGDLIIAVIDYESARIRPRVMDVANGCLQFAMVTGGHDLSKWDERTDERRARAFLRGYDAVSVLTRAELDIIPHLMQEVLIAQTVQPILRTGTFARLDGFEFMRVVKAKAEWIRRHLRFDALEPTGDPA